MDGWNSTFLLGWPIFRCHVSFRECNFSGRFCLASGVFFDVFFSFGGFGM